ncbi:MAG: hypothetical protein L3J35_09900 [Bacteroidales bacterium]|nr:hypothetical protein [Bacteroidales bacterium]
MNNNRYINNKIKVLNYVWIFFIFELVAIFGITFFVLVPKKLSQSFDSSDIGFLYLSYIISISAIPATFKIYDIIKKRLKKEASEKTKTEKYQFAVIIKFAVLEFAALISLIAFYLNETNEPLYMFGIVFIAVFLNKPSYNQLNKDFLTEADENTIEEIVYLPDENKSTEVKD